MRAQADNAVVKTWGELREERELRNHVDLVQMLDIADLDAGVSVAGALSTVSVMCGCLHGALVVLAGSFLQHSAS